MTFVFVSIFVTCFGELEVILCSSVFCQCLCYCTRPAAGQIPVLPGSAVYSRVPIIACGFTCACSLTVCSARGVLLSFSVFPLPPHPLLLLVVLLSLFPHWTLGSVWQVLGRGLGCRQGRPLGCSCYLFKGWWLQRPGFLGIQPPCATPALINKTYLVEMHLQGGSLLINPEQNRIWFQRREGHWIA